MSQPTDSFGLVNGVRRSERTKAKQPKQHQRPLFMGLDCPPGTRDLLPDLDCPPEALAAARAPDWSAEPLTADEEAALASLGFKQRKNIAPDAH